MNTKLLSRTSIKYLVSTVLFSLQLNATAQLTDRILLGDEQSEHAHGLITYCPANTSVVENGLLGESGRDCKPFDANPFCGEYAGIYGGEYSFVMQVDGTAQNYITLRTNGGDATKASERYHVQVDNKNLLNYERSAVTFSKEKAPGAFAYSTLIIPRAVTDGKQAVVVRIRSLGRYWGYAEQGNFARYQYKVEGDLPPIFAVYSSTNPIFELEDELQGKLASYSDAPARTATSLAVLKLKITSQLKNAIKSEISGSDFKPAYNNNNFNVVQCMGYAYQRGIYGTTATQLANKICVAIDSMVYINNLIKKGAKISVSAKGQTATLQSAGSGWGGLFGGQGMGIYLLWKAGKVTDDYLDEMVNLGNGNKTRRSQWVEAFRESFDAGCTYTGRRYITNQLMESAHSVYGAALALFALDERTYHNAPKLALRFMREAVGVDEWTGVPDNSKFDGSITDEEGFPTYKLGNPESTNTNLNYWGKHFHTVTACGNGREQGYTCTSCYGNLAGRICDMYLATTFDPFLSDGDKDILQVAVNNTKWQAYFTYPTVDSEGYRGIIGESSVCWRNRYDPGKTFYGSLIAGALSDDEEIMGHILQQFKDGLYDPDYTATLFPYYSHNYYLADAIDKLSKFASEHDSDYQPVPSTDGQPDYAVGDPQDGIVAIKHGDTHLFVNFLSNDNPLSSGMAHLITPTCVKSIAFVPEVLLQYHSGKYVTLPDVYWNGNHKITYPDNPQQADGGMTYERPAYNESGDYNSSRPLCQYYQQLIGKYLVAQNCSETSIYKLQPTKTEEGQQAIDLTTGQTVTLTSDITLAPMQTKVYYITSMAGTDEIPSKPQTITDATSLQSRVEELLTFAQEASQKLSTNNTPGTYSADAFMPFFRELTMAAYTAWSGTATAAETDSVAQALEEAYQVFTNAKAQTNATEIINGTYYRLYGFTNVSQYNQGNSYVVADKSGNAPAATGGGSGSPFYTGNDHKDVWLVENGNSEGTFTLYNVGAAKYLRMTTGNSSSGLSCSLGASGDDLTIKQEVKGSDAWVVAKNNTHTYRYLNYNKQNINVWSLSDHDYLYFFPCNCYALTVENDAELTVSVNLKDYLSAAKSGGYLYIDASSVPTRKDISVPEGHEVTSCSINYDEHTITIRVDEGLRGDVNGDGTVDINDVVAVINHIAGIANYERANVNEDTDETGNAIVDINDVVAVINIMAQ